MKRWPTWNNGNVASLPYQETQSHSEFIPVLYRNPFLPQQFYDLTKQGPRQRKYCTNNLCIRSFLLRYWVWKCNTGRPIFYKGVDNPTQVKVLTSRWCSRGFKLCSFKTRLIARCFFTKSSEPIERYFSVTGITDLSLKDLTWNISVWVKT